ncbi:MAG TPA: hypothetical protein VFA46_02645 [Actinomycetes bacterium]|jgi:hypothetical protein|nr:hypothetical protein [Actinomycetes bacterium]
MKELSGLAYGEVQFTKDGAVHDSGEVEGLIQLLATSGATDLFVIAHGWNNDLDDARRTYEAFFQRMREMLDEGRVAAASARTYAVLGLLWPSKRFAEESLTAGGAAGLEEPDSDDALRQQVDRLEELFDDPAASAKLDEARQLIPRLQDSPDSQRRFAELLRGLLSPDARDEEDASTTFFELPAGELMDRLGETILPEELLPTDRDGGGAAGIGLGAVPAEPAAAGLLDFVRGGPRAAARNLLNFTTYYQMKDRAGRVGQSGAREVLRRVRAARPDLRLHLIGHSFGARLVTALVVGADGQPPLQVATLSLLQAAFSHNGFALHWDGSRDGLFRRMVTGGMVSGPVVITCTQNDRAVGIAYPLASRIARQTASWLGDKNDPYGGMGRNGAQHTPEATDGFLLPVGQEYGLRPGRLYNLNADDFIANHSDICKNEVAYAVLTAVAGA